MSKLGFIFPGQGSQKTGMMAELADRYDQVNSCFSQASDVLGIDLWQTCQQQDPAQLNTTEITQPALLTASVAIWRIWQDENGPMPDVMAGHSLGEYSALVCAEALSLEQAVSLVHQRGKFMQSAVPSGSGKMAAIVGLDDAAIAAACEQASQGEVVAPANFNSLGQTVIAGEASAVERAMQACKEAGAKRVLPLAVSVPSHCDLMKPAADAMSELLATLAFNSPKIPVIHNVNAKTSSSVSEIKENLVAQLSQPVQWVDTIRAMAAAEVNRVVECGPGKVLCGLVKRTEKEIECGASEDLDSLTKSLGH